MNRISNVMTARLGCLSTYRGTFIVGCRYFYVENRLLKNILLNYKFRRENENILSPKFYIGKFYFSLFRILFVFYFLPGGNQMF